jgi:hypothetical protein
MNTKKWSSPLPTTKRISELAIIAILRQGNSSQPNHELALGDCL